MSTESDRSSKGVDVQILETLQRRFERADDQWPNLHHAFIHFGIGVQGLSPVRFFQRAVVQFVVSVLAPEYATIECTSSSQANLSVFWGSNDNDISGLRLFHKLSLAVARALWPDEVAFVFKDARWHTVWWTDSWIAAMQSEGRERNDPILRVNRYDLRIGEHESDLELVPGFTVPIPTGMAVSLKNERETWRLLLPKYAKSGLAMFTLEQGLFQASAYALARITSGDWAELKPPKNRPSADDLVILRALVNAKCSLVQTDIVEHVTDLGTRFSRGTVGKRLAVLEGAGLVHYPHGRRKGAAPTDRGHELVVGMPAER